MSDSLPQKTIDDHFHLAARTVLSAIPTLGGAALELFNAVIAPPLEQRRNRWLNELAQRLDALEKEKRLKIEDVVNNDEFISAVMHATTVAVRNHQHEKIEALRNAVLNSALGQNPSDVKSAMFLAFVDQFTVWHLLVLRELSALDTRQGQSRPPKTSIEEITRVVLERIAEMRAQQPLAEFIVEDLCRKGLLFWSGGLSVTYIPNGTTQVTPLGQEFLKFISEP